jgi:hypothetical protein
MGSSDSIWWRALVDPNTDKKLLRESRTLTAMVRMYCRDTHGSQSGLCDECTTLHEYAQKRLAHCRFGPDKPVCSKCPVHCYRPEMRQRVAVVMRYSGPRMLRRHPVLGLSHLVDKRRPAPDIQGSEDH